MHFEAARARAEIRHNETMSLAWHIVALQRQKRLPPLSRLTRKSRVKKPRRQTWEEQLGIMRLFKGVTTHYPEEIRDG